MAVCGNLFEAGFFKTYPRPVDKIIKEMILLIFVFGLCDKNINRKMVAVSTCID